MVVDEVFCRLCPDRPTCWPTLANFQKPFDNNIDIQITLVDDMSHRRKICQNDRNEIQRRSWCFERVDQI